MRIADALFAFSIFSLLSLVACGSEKPTETTEPTERSDNPSSGSVQPDDEEPPEGESEGSGPVAKEGPAPTRYPQATKAQIDALIVRLEGDESEQGMALMTVPSHPGHYESNPDLAPRILEALVKVARSDGSQVTCGAAVGKICEFQELAAGVVPELVALLDKADARAFVAREAHKIGPAAEPVMLRLVELLGHDDRGARAQSAEGLGFFGEDASSAVPALLALLETEEHALVKSKAARALGKIGAKEAIPALEELAASSDGRTRFAAREALKQLGE